MLQIIKSARRLSLSIAWTAAMVVACATGLLGKAHAQTKIVEGFVSHGALQWPEYIASEFGWFKENGIDLDMLVVGAGAAQQVAAGVLNLGYSGFPDFIRAINQGAPVRIVINKNSTNNNKINIHHDQKNTIMSIAYYNYIYISHHMHKIQSQLRLPCK